ncbi:MAG: excinuclease ABC subunit UvrA, partial [Bacteroidetes bacterium]
MKEHTAEDLYIEVEGAREHNLKNIHVKIPRDQLVVITGLSGSGKSSLAFDTIYAEGQRRYLESFASYARSFIGKLERPDVDKISGLSPVISIEQKTVNKNPRSTVGTITEIYDFLRLLYARVSTAYSYVSGKPMVKYSEKEIIHTILKEYIHRKILVLAPLVKGRKGHYRELFDKLRKQGFAKVKIDGEIKDLSDVTKVDRYKIHDIEVVIDRIAVSEKVIKRISDALQLAFKQGNGSLLIEDYETGDVKHFSRSLMCPDSGISYQEPSPNTFSFNSPYGACKKCGGLGEISKVDIEKIIPDKTKSVKKGGLAPLGEFKQNWIFHQIEGILKKHGYTLNTPLKEVSEEALNDILYGTAGNINVHIKELGFSKNYNIDFKGIANILSDPETASFSKSFKKWSEKFMNKIPCPDCQGTRLQKESLYFKIDNKNIAEASAMQISELYDWISELPEKLSDNQNIIAQEIIREISKRISFLIDVGLDYLTLNRSSKSLSGGEAQRIRLASQIGSQLTGVLYILDEPSIGLHQRDNDKLIKVLKNLRDIGNSILVVEHDKEIMEQSDYIIDIGPKAGVHGGKVVATGKYQEILKTDTLTSAFLSAKEQIKIPEQRRKGSGKTLTVKGAEGHNLKNIDVAFPLGVFICVTGVSGSGKSTLVNEILYPALSNKIYRSEKQVLKHKAIEGIENIDKVIAIDQAPIGRTPRSNPATYTKVFDDIRLLFSSLPQAQIRGYKPGRFSFNVKGGRCESCKGAGVNVIEMNFLPDVYVECEECGGKRYNKETLEVRYKGKNISDVLNMTIEQAVDFFENIPQIHRKVKTLYDVGLGYITLGQPSTTLSGGEAQRIKLASELLKKDTGNTFYILDEPSTGLHFQDIKILLDVLQKLV